MSSLFVTPFQMPQPFIASDDSFGCKMNDAGQNGTNAKWHQQRAKWKNWIVEAFRAWHAFERPKNPTWVLFERVFSVARSKSIGVSLIPLKASCAQMKHVIIIISILRRHCKKKHWFCMSCDVSTSDAPQNRHSVVSKRFFDVWHRDIYVYISHYLHHHKLHRNCCVIKSLAVWADCCDCT